MTDKYRWMPMVFVMIASALGIQYGWLRIADDVFLGNHFIKSFLQNYNMFLQIIHNVNKPLEYDTWYVVAAPILAGLIWYLIGVKSKIHHPDEVLNFNRKWWIIYFVILFLSFASISYWIPFLMYLKTEGFLFIFMYHATGVFIPYFLGSILFSPVVVESVIPGSGIRFGSGG